MTENRENQQDDSEGQVSEVASMDPAASETPISDDQGVAGNPEADDSMAGDEAGPNAKPKANVESNRS
ncbi:MAG TPA: hypothetical protein VMF51_03925 [Nocardioides sp.]|uniref:hypothetical protein n=1 Tax=Nocardioides sp. TaxID=35761 RepID=UPI002C5388E6|nr:hypothetical protein [Nocardioides sp.]HTW14252.1 hypothetical protein [Nocardioides sp.]